MGDPAGIGPEVSIKASQDKEILELCCPVLIGDKGLLKQRAENLGLPFDFLFLSEINNEAPSHLP